MLRLVGLESGKLWKSSRLSLIIQSPALCLTFQTISYHSVSRSLSDVPDYLLSFSLPLSV